MLNQLEKRFALGWLAEQELEAALEAQPREYTKLLVIPGTTRKDYATNNSGGCESCQEMTDNIQELSNFGGRGHWNETLLSRTYQSSFFKTSDAAAIAHLLWV